VSCRVGAHVPPHAVHQPSCTPRWRCPARFRLAPAESAASPRAHDLSAAQLRRGALRRSITVIGLITISVSASDLASAMDPPRLLMSYHSASYTPGRPRVSRRSPSAWSRTSPVPLHGSARMDLAVPLRHLCAEPHRDRGAGSSADTGAVCPACRYRSNSTRLDSVLPARASGRSQQAPPVDNVNTARPSQRSSAKIGSEYAKNSRTARTELEHPRRSHRTSVSCFLMPG
jgi:hypothetical protein